MVHILKLTENMCARSNPSYAKLLLKVGSGEEPTVHDEIIKVPDDMVIHWENECSINTLIHEIFRNLSDNATIHAYTVERVLLTPLNGCVNKLNERVLRFFSGDEHTFYSFDSVDDDTQNL